MIIKTIVVILKIIWTCTQAAAIFLGSLDLKIPGNIDNCFEDGTKELQLLGWLYFGWYII